MPPYFIYWSVSAIFLLIFDKLYNSFDCIINSFYVFDKYNRININKKNNDEHLLIKIIINTDEYILFKINQ